MPGLPNAAVIPAGWEAAHAPVANAVMTATCTVTRLQSTAGQPTYDDVTGRSVYPAATTVYTGQCRMQRASRPVGAGAAVIGDKMTPTYGYVLSIPLTAAELQVNDVVTIDAATDDEFEGHTFTVVETRGGSLVWQRDYGCEERSPTTR